MPWQPCSNVCMLILYDYVVESVLQSTMVV